MSDAKPVPRTDQNVALKTIDIGKTDAPQTRSDAHAGRKQQGLLKPVASSLVDFTLILSLLFGGCCTNAWSYEHILRMDSHLGTALTFSQMCFITLHSLPSFIHWDRHSCLPYAERRHVPLRQWAAQVLVLTSSSLLNNWAFAFHVPLTVQIVFRSAGLAVAMLLGFLIFKRRYPATQIVSLAVVSIGVLLATLSRPTSSKSSDYEEAALSARYALGIMMMTVSLLLTGILGMLQEHTYSTYGPYWKEGVFYTHLLSLPLFLFLVPDVKYGFKSLSSHTQSWTSPTAGPWISAIMSRYSPYIVLATNLITQLICVSAVNQLTSRVTSVSTNLVLTARKALSLCFSVWWFGSGWNAQLSVGAGLVFIGSLLYTLVNSGSNIRTSTESIADGTSKRRKRAKRKTA
ncbi:UAA transporter [Laetiporus sulphureus 93-53]|uniref:UAA transporter n=1 Tax=Laetiporus sulphureus 93-53 TaxID=1314785 RepID=A0A165G699_9APHY|nr:UAA transporter [Laetiporus sulphureus 93-53]KZT09883.1 UAA transporter [Laetiporus sulphureus 93-53]